MKLHEDLSDGSRMTDGQTDVMNLIAAFGNFSKRPKKDFAVNICCSIPSSKLML